MTRHVFGGTDICLLFLFTLASHMDVSYNAASGGCICLSK